MASFRPALTVFVCSIIGFIIAALEYMLYENEYVIHYYATTSEEITGLMIVTVLLWMIMGGLLAAVYNR